MNAESLEASLLWGPEKKGGQRQLRRVTANAVSILANDRRWAGVLAFDAFREDVVALRLPPWSPDDMPATPKPGTWSEADTVRCANWLAREWRLELGAIAVDQAISVVAARVVVHPVRDYLVGLAWDGKPRIERLFSGYFGAACTEYTQAISSRWMLGAVARVMRPGAKVDCTPVLEGKQGIGKSTGVRTLAGDEWFFDTPITMGEKDSLQALRAKWICELAELHALNRSDLNKAKAFLTATSDTYRATYGRRTRDYPRQIVFVATTNGTAYLRDETGGRRFWPVQCGAVDLAALRRDRDQLWAEATMRFHQGEPWHVDSTELGELCAAEQEERFAEDAWEAPISDWLGAPGHPERRRDGVTSGDVLGGAVKLEPGRWTKGDADRAAGILRRLGWERGRQERVGAARVRRWRPKSAEPVTGGDEPVTPPVTGDSSTDHHMSPVSPADAHARMRAHARTFAISESACPGGDTGDVVTEHAFADLLLGGPA